MVEAFHTSLVELERLNKELISASLHNQSGDFVRYRQARLVFYNGRKIVVKEYMVLEPTTFYSLENKVLTVVS